MIMLPEIITYKKIRQFEGKVLTVNESTKFNVKRTYWINYDSNDTTQSEHAHKTLEQVIVAISGEVQIDLEGPDGTQYSYILNDPSQGLYIPAKYWKKISYNKQCILFCFASEIFNEADYIRSYDKFKELVKS